MTVGLNSRPIEWSRPPEPHPPDAGCWCSRNKTATVCELDLVQHAIRSWKGPRPWIRNNGRRTVHEPLNLTLDVEHAHVSGHLSIDSISAALHPAATIRRSRWNGSRATPKGH